MMISKSGLDNIDRWGPGVVAVLALLAVIAIGWVGSAHNAKLEGIIVTQDREIRGIKSNIDETNHNQAIELRDIKDDVSMYQAYMIVLQHKMIEHGIQVPDIPQRQQRQIKDR